MLLALAATLWMQHSPAATSVRLLSESAAQNPTWLRPAAGGMSLTGRPQSSREQQLVWQRVAQQLMQPWAHRPLSAWKRRRQLGEVWRHLSVQSGAYCHTCMILLLLLCHAAVLLPNAGTAALKVVKTGTHDSSGGNALP